MTYAEKLRDPRWQKRRLEIYQRDNFTCQECLDTTKTLNCHHLDYENGVEPWDYPAEYLITLCEDCHKDVDDYRKPIETLVIKSMRLSLKDYFSYVCAEGVFKTSPDLQRIIYLLWDIGVEKAVSVLESFQTENKEDIPHELIKSVESKQRCVACGGNMIFYEKYKHYKCDTCGFDIPVSDKKFEELTK